MSVDSRRFAPLLSFGRSLVNVMLAALIVTDTQRTADAAQPISGKDVTITGLVRMNAYLLESPGPNGTTHLDAWEVRDGRTVTAYDIDMTKIMHMIVVSDDLTDFAHVHPELGHNGHLTIDLPLPQRPGGYHVYIDGRPSGVGRQVFRFDLPSPIAPIARVPHAAGDAVNVGPYTVKISPTKIPIGEIATVSVSILKNGRPANDLHPYLGVMAHGVFIGMKNLAYMHAHGMSAAMLDMAADDCGDSMMAAMTPMPPNLNIGNSFDVEILAPSEQPYNFWLQFVGGKTVYTAPFLVTTI
jgi:hypothetical protein